MNCHLTRAVIMVDDQKFSISLIVLGADSVFTATCGVFLDELYFRFVADQHQECKQIIKIHDNR